MIVSPSPAAQYPSPQSISLPPSDTGSLPRRLAHLCRLAGDVVRDRRDPELLLATLEQEEAAVVDSLERLDALVERQGSSRAEAAARNALLGYLELILRFSAALG